jgi:hypothetical protein
MTTPPEGWEGILAPGETILWQGRPDGRVIWGDVLQFPSLFGLIFAGMAWGWLQGVRWMAASMTGGTGGLIVFELVGGLFIAVGAYMVIGRIVVGAFLRRRTWYTLTNRAAYLATEVFGKRQLRRIGIAEMNMLVHSPIEPDTIWLRREVSVNRYHRHGPQGRRGARVRTSTRHFGFEHIADVDAVRRLLVDLREALPKDDPA